MRHLKSKLYIADTPNGEKSTLIMPVFSQVDFENSYKAWYTDKPSETVYLTEYFPKLPFVYRSNQETHFVTARGKLAYELTYQHKRFELHTCPCGEYAFAVVTLAENVQF